MSIQGNTVRLHRIIAETTVEKLVSLCKVEGHRNPTATSKGRDVLTEKVSETNDTDTVGEVTGSAWGSGGVERFFAPEVPRVAPELCRELGDGLIRRRSLLACW